MRDVVIAGAGPAGLSAAIYAKRRGFSVAVLFRDGGALEKSGLIENYFGFASPVSGAELLKRGREQATRLECELIHGEATGIALQDGIFSVTTSENEVYQSKNLVLATGVNRKTPKISGLSDYEGKGVSYCAVCDGFFYKNRDVCVLGNGNFALAEALHLANICKSVTILTNSAPVECSFPESFKVVASPITNFFGNSGFLQGVAFSDGTGIYADGVFIALGIASADDFARRLGVPVKDDCIIANPNGSTTVPSLFAAGDCVFGTQRQIAAAAASGASVGYAINRR